jgi:tetratricopeptide (TPR) repeat protein
VNRKWFYFWLVCVTVFICFLPDLRNDLLDWDDSGYIVENTHIYSLSFATVKWAFTSFYLNYWAPLTWLSLAVDHAIWGNNPLGYHLVNIVLHSLNAGIFFLISLALLSVYEKSTNDRLPALSPYHVMYCSLLASLFFGVHPLRVESVAWATERKDVLALAFGLFAILFYLRYAALPAGRRCMSCDYWLSLVFFFLSLCCKSLMISLPVVLLVLDWFPLGRSRSLALPRILLEKLPYFLLSCGAAMLTVMAQLQAIEPINGYTRMLNGFRSIVAYLWLTVWPFGVSPFYVHPSSIQGLPLEYAFSISLFLVITFICFLLLKRRPVFMAVWLIYLVCLLPFLGFTQQVGAQAMAGRFTYLAGLPLALLLAVGTRTLYLRCSFMNHAVIVLGMVVVFILLANAFLTVREINFWKDDVTLWTRVIEQSPNTGRAYFQRSNAYRLKRDYPKSLADITHAISIAKNKRYGSMHELYWARAVIYAALGEYNHAIADYSRALETATATSRSMILFEMQMVYQKSGRVDPANAGFSQPGK